MEKKTIKQTIFVGALCVFVSVLLLGVGNALTALRAISLLIGCLCASASVAALAAMVAHRTQKGTVGIYLILHVLCTFLPTILALFVPWLDALGVIIPQLIFIPVLALCSLFEKE